MIIITIFLFMTIGGWFWLSRVGFMSDCHFPAFMLGMLGTLGLVLCLLTAPLTRMEVRAGIEKYHSVQHTLNAARKNGESIENAALQMKIVDVNKDIASLKYYNNTVFDIWIPDEVVDLEPIQ